MTDEQRNMILNLEKCSFGVGSNEKRFVRNMVAILKATPEVELSPRQDWYLRRIYWRYRGQIGHSDPKPADFDNPPPPRTKAQEELAERKARGEIIVCRGPVGAETQLARELELLRAWNEGQARHG